MTDVQGPLTEAEGHEGLKLARRSLEHWVTTGQKLKVETPFTGGLAQPLGAFVTIHTRDGELRGCIGHLIGEGPLGRLLIDLAIAAGTHDTRFDPVTESELADLIYEISVLSPMKRTRPEDVKPGLHGLLVHSGPHTGVLLPQVAQRYDWDAETFLGETCRKAGLHRGAWKDPATHIFTFTAQIFHELPPLPSPRG